MVTPPVRRALILAGLVPGAGTCGGPEQKKAPEAGALNHHMGAVPAQLGDREGAAARLCRALADEAGYPGRAGAQKLLKEIS